MQLRLCWLIALVLCAGEGAGAPLSINDGRPIFVDTIPFTITGTAEPNAEVMVVLSGAPAPPPARADANGIWSVTWTTPLKTGTYDLTITSEGTTVTQILRVQLPGRLQRQSGVEPPPPRYAPIELPNPGGSEIFCTVDAVPDSPGGML